jgi:hypothetical protein
MTRPWLSVSRAADVTPERAIGEATAIGTFYDKISRRIAARALD